MHVYVRRKFELHVHVFPINTGFFYKFLNLLKYMYICKILYHNYSFFSLLSLFSPSLVGRAFTSSFFPPGNGSIFMNNMACFGSEGYLAHCPYQDNVAGCTHASEAGARCYRPGKFIYNLFFNLSDTNIISLPPSSLPPPFLPPSLPSSLPPSLSLSLPPSLPR